MGHNPKRQAMSPSLFHGIAIENHGTFERPLFRLADVSRLVEIPGETIRADLDSDEWQGRRCELTGAEEVFVTEPGLYQALFWGESPAAEAFKCRVMGVITGNPALKRKADELLADCIEDHKKPRA